MTTNTTKKAAGASNTNGLHTDTNNGDFLLGVAINQARCNAISSRDAGLMTTSSTALVAICQSRFIASKARSL